jgi:hypothetical protein
MTRGITNGGSVQGERERKATKGGTRGNPRSGMSLSLHWWKALVYSDERKRSWGERAEVGIK